MHHSNHAVENETWGRSAALRASPSTNAPPGVSATHWLGWCAAWGILVFICGGATCANRNRLSEFAPPVIFEQQPTLPQISEVVNRSLKIERLESNTLTIISPELVGKLSGKLAWERPHNFSLQAYPAAMQMLGIAFAAGSNQEMFWLQQQMPSPTFYYARHDDFNSQVGPRNTLPVSPLWLREALGVVELDPALQHNGPTLRPDGHLEIESFIPMPQGAYYRRVLVLDGSTATVIQSALYNHAQKLVAFAQQSNHQYYGAIDWSLPHRVDIQLRPDEGPALAFTMEVEFYLINEMGTADPNEFRPPDTTGLSTVNLAGGNASAAAATPPGYSHTYNQRPHPLDNYRIVR